MGEGRYYKLKDVVNDTVPEMWNLYVAKTLEYREWGSALYSSAGTPVAMLSEEGRRLAAASPTSSQAAAGSAPESVVVADTPPAAAGR